MAPSTPIRPGPLIRSFQDPPHEDLHLRGEFRTVRGDLKLNEAISRNRKIDIEIDTSSIHTRDEQRDAHLRRRDFLDKDPSLLTFRSTKSKKRESMPSAAKAT